MKKTMLLLGVVAAIVAVAQTVDFDTQIQPIFDQKCGGCHGSSGGLDLAAGVSYSNLVEVTSQNYPPALRVTSGESDSSVLYHKISDTGVYGGVMPTYGKMSQENIDLIATWITELEPTTVVEKETVLPRSFSLMQNFPNPFNPTTKIAFRIPQAVSARLVIYNVQGHLVTTLLNQYLNAGEYQLEWNGLDELGNSVASGVYFYQLKIGNRNLVRKMVLMQ